MSKTRVDESHWPLAVVSVAGEPSEESFEELLSSWGTLLRRREAHCIVFDLRRMAPIGAKLRKRQVQWLIRNEALLRAYLLGAGMVMETAEQRGALRAILWMRPLPFPFTVVSSLEEARRFVSARWLERGRALAPSPELPGPWQPGASAPAARVWPR